MGYRHGNTASKKDIEEVHKFIKEIINTNYQFNYDLPFYMADQLIPKTLQKFLKLIMLMEFYRKQV